MRLTLLLLAASFCAVAQTPDASLTFEVASVKPSVSLPGGVMMVARKSATGPGSPAGNASHFVRRNTPLATFLTMAYGLQPQQLIGPDWLTTERYDIEANAAEGTTPAQQMVMLQNLLTQRFGMKLHRDTREMPVYELVVAKGGPKFKEAATGEYALTPMRPGGPFALRSTDRGTMVSLREAGTMEALAGRLSPQAGRTILDRTGLKGIYDIELTWTPNVPNSGDGTTPPDPGITVPAAVESQLGLKLESKKGTVSVLIVDHAEKVPTAN